MNKKTRCETKNSRDEQSYIINSRNLSGQLLPNQHEGEAQQVLAFPEVGFKAVFVVHGHADAPDFVLEGAFGQDVGMGGQELRFQVRVLAEFSQEGPVDHDLADAVPDGVAVTPDGAAKGLDLAHIVCG